jgi:phosphoglycerate dehydrogenase-like enzyme
MDVLEAARDAQIYLGFGIPASIMEAGGNSLQWVHSGAAGVGGSLHEAMIGSRVRFTNSAGIHGPPIAETVVGALLYFARGLDFAVSAKSNREWNAIPFLAAETPVREIAGMTVGILGYGGIGEEIASRLAVLGVHVLGYCRTPRGGDEDEIGVTLLHGPEGLARLIEESEALVLAAPLTSETRGILSRERIGGLPKGAVVVNIARGGLVDEEALVAALRDGRLRGAALDVFTAEPLSEDHPLWSLSNVLITPHTAAVSRGFWRRETSLIVENVRRFFEGEPLINEVDRDRGY